jgi:spore maturation protein CgeB
MNHEPLRIVILGLSITSSWGNGHATTFRGLVQELAARGHEVLFLERDVPWYAQTRDLQELQGARVELYSSIEELNSLFHQDVSRADAVIVGSYVPEGVAVAEWVISVAQGITCFYDIDTPITLAKLRRGDTEYLAPDLIPRFQLYLSFTGGPMCRSIETEFGSPMARPLYCSVDPARYYPEVLRKAWDLGFLGTYSADRQPALQRLLLEPATQCPVRRFIVAGSQFPPDIAWPPNVERIEHLPPAVHRQFYNQQCFTLNLTRADMVQAGYSPSVRLFEAAACGVPIITDDWPGLEEFFVPGVEIFVARSSHDMLHYLQDITPAQARAVGNAARRRVLAHHTAHHRAAELEGYLRQLRAGPNSVAALPVGSTSTLWTPIAL